LSVNAASSTEVDVNVRVSDSVIESVVTGVTSLCSTVHTCVTEVDICHPGVNLVSTCYPSIQVDREVPACERNGGHKLQARAENTPDADRNISAYHISHHVIPNIRIQLSPSRKQPLPPPPPPPAAYYTRFATQNPSRSNSVRYSVPGQRSPSCLSTSTGSTPSSSKEFRTNRHVFFTDDIASVEVTADRCNDRSLTMPATSSFGPSTIMGTSTSNSSPSMDGRKSSLGQNNRRWSHGGRTHVTDECPVIGCRKATTDNNWKHHLDGYIV